MGEKALKRNYRSVSILPNVSKIYGKIIFVQMTEFFEKRICNYLSDSKQRTKINSSYSE